MPDKTWYYLGQKMKPWATFSESSTQPTTCPKSLMVVGRVPCKLVACNHDRTGLGRLSIPIMGRRRERIPSYDCVAGVVQPRACDFSWQGPTLLTNAHRQWIFQPLLSPDGRYVAFQAQTLTATSGFLRISKPRAPQN